MSIALLSLIIIIIFALAYFIYGRFVSKNYKLDDSVTTPACAVNDGVDYVPAKAPMLLAQHFSAIAAAGPIAGPILAGQFFGWVPTLLWIVIGCIFIGAVHDFSSLITSVRNKARSIAEIVKENLGKRAFILFMLFIWLSLNYVIIAFTDLTAGTFVGSQTVENEIISGGGVATSSMLYLLLAVIMGLFLYKLKTPLWLATITFVPLIFVVVWLGQLMPISEPRFIADNPIKSWSVIILAYCFIASIVPLWSLLQPRGYLGGYLLYIVLLSAFIGLLFGGFQISGGAPAFTSFFPDMKGSPGPLFPMLFVTVACGACSGFHGIVCSGTTSKQIEKETDTKPIGYGGMLLEGIVAFTSLATVMIIVPKAGTNPEDVYRNGIGQFLTTLGVSLKWGTVFAALAFTTFIYDTLDVATRLGRYIFQELLGWYGNVARYGATAATLVLPFIFLMSAEERAWRAYWWLFGTSNQLLAALTLLGISVWLLKTGRNVLITLLPMLFVMAMTLWSLARYVVAMVEGKGNTVVGISSIILIILSALLVIEAANIFLRHLRKRA